MEPRRVLFQDAPEAIVGALENIAAAIRGDPQNTGALGLSVRIVIGRGRRMKQAPDLNLSDVQRVQLAIAPKLADGSDDPGPFSWSSSDSTVAQIVGVSPADGGPDLTQMPIGPVVWVLTPAGPGTATITVATISPNVEAEAINLVITEGRMGALNLSAGTPVSDQ